MCKRYEELLAMMGHWEKLHLAQSPSCHTTLQLVNGRRYIWMGYMLLYLIQVGYLMQAKRANQSVKKTNMFGAHSCLCNSVLVLVGD